AVDHGRDRHGRADPQRRVLPVARLPSVVRRHRTRRGSHRTPAAARPPRGAVRPAGPEPHNLQARADMLMSSMMGAIAFQKDLGAVHSCAHALSTVADLHHGLANGIMIDHVMRFNLPAATVKLAELAHVVGVAKHTADASAQAFIDWLVTLKRDLAIPPTLSAY